MKQSKHRLAGALVAAAALAGSTVAAPAAHAAPAAPGTRSLASVLAADGDRFDHDWHDYDIVYRAVLAVLKANPESDVAVLADGNVRLTAFIPTDRAFRRLVHAVTGHWKRSERAVFRAVKGLGVDTVEAVLLYHVVPGATITYREARQADGAELTTASGGTITVKVREIKGRHWVYLRDADRDARNPRVVDRNLNKGNKQIAHGIGRVLRPIDL